MFNFSCKVALSAWESVGIALLLKTSLVRPPEELQFLTIVLRLHSGCCLVKTLFFLHALVTLSHLLWLKLIKSLNYSIPTISQGR